MEISKELLSEVLGYEALPTQVSTKNLQYIDKRRKHGAFQILLLATLLPFAAVSHIIKITIENKNIRKICKKIFYKN